MSTKINYTQQIKKQGYCILPQIFNISQVEDLLNDIKTLYQETKNKISQDTPYLNTNQPNVYNLQNKNVKFIDTLLGIEKIEKILIDCLNDNGINKFHHPNPIIFCVLLEHVQAIHHYPYI